MAIFQTGAATSIPNLLDTLAAFAVANGWVQNFNAVEGSGRRVHLQKGTDVFINLRATVGEYPIQPGYTNPNSGLIMNGSTGYNGSLNWYSQPGAAYVGADPLNRVVVGITGVVGSVPNYYMFARGSMIYLWLEYTTGQYQWLMFGKINKTSTWVGGAIFAASSDGRSDNIENHQTLASQPNFGMGNLQGNPNAYMYGVIEGNTGWLGCYSNPNLNVPMPKFFDTMAKEGILAMNLANTYNSQIVLLPLEICITRDGTATWEYYTNFSIEGKLPDIFYCNLRTLVPAQQLDDGSGDVFRVFPFRFKNSDGSSGGWYGVAIKEN